MGRTKSSSVILPTKVPPIWQIGILFPDGKKIAKPKCTLNEILETYFIGLDKYISKGFTSEELLNKYKETFELKGIKVQINYIDSYGHKWTGKCAWPRENKFIEYLEKRLGND